MRLRNDLQRIADTAPPPPDPDAVLRRAQAIRARRLVVVPAVAVVAVVAVLVLTITYLSRVDGAGPAASVAFQFEGGALDPAMLDRARGVLEARARAVGLGHARARVEGDRILLEFDADSPEVDFKELAAPGRLELRKVIETTSGEGTLESTPSPGGGPEASTLDEVAAKVGPEVFAQARALDSVADDLFRPFASLTPKEVRLLPARMQFYVPAVSCEQLDAAPIVPEATAEFTACQSGYKLLLDVAEMSGADLAGATPDSDPQARAAGHDSHVVTLRFNRAGQAKWADLTARVAGNVGCAPRPDAGHCQLAVLVDSEVVAAPAVLAALAADSAALVAGLPTAGQARMMAAKMSNGELPAGLKVSG